MKSEKRDADYYTRSIHFAIIREQLGGCRAAGSSMVTNAISGLFDLGWSKQQIAEIINREFES